MYTAKATTTSTFSLSQTTSCATPDHAEYNTVLNLQINNATLNILTYPWVSSFTAKLTCSKHIDDRKPKKPKIYPYLKSSLQPSENIITLCIQTCKTITSVCLQHMRIYGIHNKHYKSANNTALCIATGCTFDINIQHLHDETMLLLHTFNTHLRLEKKHTLALK